MTLGRGVAAGVDAYENEVEGRAEEVWEGVQLDIVVRTCDGSSPRFNSVLELD